MEVLFTEYNRRAYLLNAENVDDILNYGRRDFVEG